MSQLSGLLRGGIGRGNSPSRATGREPTPAVRKDDEATSEQGLRLEANRGSLLPAVGAAASASFGQALGHLGGLLSASKTRSLKPPSMATPRQLEHVMQGKSIGDLPGGLLAVDVGLGESELSFGAGASGVAVGDGAMAETKVLFRDEGVVFGDGLGVGVGGSSDMVTFVVVTEEEDGVCGGKLSGGLKFCISPRNECGSKSHRTGKADLNMGHVYLTAPDARAKLKRTGIASWHVSVAVFGPRFSEVLDLNLSVSEFKRFAEILDAMYKEAGWTASNWSAAINLVKRPLHFGTPAAGFHPKRSSEGPSPSLRDDLKDWVPVSPQTKMDPVEQDFDDSTRNNNVAFNLELLKVGLESFEARALSDRVKDRDELDNFRNQLHALKISLGSDPGFYEDSPLWDVVVSLNARLIDLQREGRDAAESRDVSLKLEIMQSMEGFVRQAITDGLEDANRRYNRLEFENTNLKAQLSQTANDLSGLQRSVSRIQGISASASPAVPASMSADWSLILDFFSRNTSANASSLGDMIAPASPASVPALVGPSATVMEEIKDIKDRLISDSVSIDGFTFATLTKTIQWATAFLPHDVDQALVCTDGVAFMHGIGKDFATTDETRNTMYQNKRAGISSAALNLHSSFQTTLPQILGISSTTVVEDTKLLLPCAKSYDEWFCISDGVTTGVKPQIVEGLDTQKAIYQEMILELEYTHPDAAKLATLLLERSLKFDQKLLALVDEMWTDGQARKEDVTPGEQFAKICAVIRQIFRLLRAVRQRGAAAMQQKSEINRIGCTWWFVLQTHRLMDELMVQDFVRHPGIIPVFTNHIDRYRVSKTTHHALEVKVAKIKTDMDKLTLSVNKLQGGRGNRRNADQEEKK